MLGPQVSINGVLRPTEEAVVSVDDVYFAYGFGVYESMKLRKGVLYFPERHEERLFHSARIIGIEHNLQPGDLVEHVTALCRANGHESVNLKILLIGGRTADDARLYIMQLNPLYPDRKLYKKGASALLQRGERQFPDAKSLNMTMSARAYQRARAAGAYDALFEHEDGLITEGTRTNLFFTDGEHILTPPKHLVLDGVTRQTILECAADKGYPVQERLVHRGNLPSLPGLFLSSTSSKIMPLSLVMHEEQGEHVGQAEHDYSFEIPELVRSLMSDYNTWLDDYAASQEPIVPS